MTCLAAVIATGRSNDSNQVDNVLAFPGVFRGLLDSGARTVTTSMKIAAARTLARSADHPRQALPSVFDPAVVPAVAAAIAAAASAAGGAEDDVTRRPTR
jgi:malate dehydrogenase (oxaloacetate-decarboxylating)